MYDTERSSFKVEVRMLKQRIAELEAQAVEDADTIKKMTGRWMAERVKVERLEAENEQLRELLQDIDNEEVLASEWDARAQALLGSE